MDAASLLIHTAHAIVDDLPWVPSRPGMEIRYIHCSASRRMSAVQIRAQPGATTGLHRHLGPVLGYTTKGAWSHDPRDYIYRPNSYICEPNELHRFFNGPQVTEAIYISFGDTEFVDDEGREVVLRANAAAGLARYFQLCEEKGLPRPNVLQD